MISGYSYRLAQPIADADEPEAHDFGEAQRLLLSKGISAVRHPAELFRPAAELRNPLAEYDLGYCYEYGIGVAIDKAQALTWYRRAASDAQRDDLLSMAKAAIANLELQPIPGSEQTTQLRPASPVVPAPAPVQAPPSVQSSEMPVSAGANAPSQPSAGTPPPAPASTAFAMPRAIASRPALEPPLPPALVLSLLNRGNEMLRAGNISAARLLLTRAAESGSGEAAMIVGETYDPRFLSQIGAKGLVADPIVAADWYRRALSLGSRDADRLLAGVSDTPVPAR